MGTKIKKEVPQSSSLPGKQTLFERPGVQFIIISLVALLLYGNTLFNQFALDDGMVLLENKFVLEGIGGIPDIFMHDSFFGSIGSNENLNGGRYRPLSLVTFAIEVSIFGKDPFIHHLFNVILYVLTCVVLLFFLRTFIFQRQPLAAFVAALLFTIHPVHTEVIANIKSRDEILSLLFLLLTLHYLLLYLTVSKKQVHYFVSIICYALALLSKENGIIFVAIIPLSVYFFSEKKVYNSIITSIPWLAVVGLYVVLRLSLFEINYNQITEVMDNPYLLASTGEKYATIAFVLLRYLQLLFWPWPLTYDYSYNHIPYRNFSDALVWLSIIIHLLMIAIAWRGVKRKDIISWCIIFYLAGIFIISNFIFNIGAPMAERFLFQASVAFVIVVVEVVRRGLTKWNVTLMQKMLTAGTVLTIITLMSAYATINRNVVWKSNETLFLNDVKISSGSARANTYAGVALIKLCDQADDKSTKRSYAEQALDYFKKSSAIKKDYITTLLNMGVAYSRLDSAEAAEKVWMRAKAINPENQNFVVYDKYLGESFYIMGLQEAVKKNLTACISYFEKSVYYDPNNAEAWYNLGGAYFTIRQYDKAKSCWQKTLQLNPKQQEAAAGLKAIEQGAK